MGNSDPLGRRVLAAGGSSLDAIQTAVVVLEDSRHFNAGRGAVFTHEGTNELDAAIMDGRTRMAGAVAAVKRIKNPIRLARLVMAKSPHVMMVGDGAEAFAREQNGIEFVPESCFHTDLRRQQLQRALEVERSKQSGLLRPRSDDPTQGTYFGSRRRRARPGGQPCGCDLDWGRHQQAIRPRRGFAGDWGGHVCEQSELRNLRHGHGRVFHPIHGRARHLRVEYTGTTAQQAAGEVVQDVLKRAGGGGGVIGLDRVGRVVVSSIPPV